MRTILFFDLPTLTSNNIKNYRLFVKNIKKLGFYMIQESVYVKMSIDFQMAENVVQKIKSISPTNGNIMLLTITEKQFQKIVYVIGEVKTNVLCSDERTVIL